MIGFLQVDSAFTIFNAHAVHYKICKQKISANGSLSEQFALISFMQNLFRICLSISRKHTSAGAHTMTVSPRSSGLRLYRFQKLRKPFIAKFNGTIVGGFL